MLLAAGGVRASMLHAAIYGSRCLPNLLPIDGCLLPDPFHNLRNRAN